MLLTSAAFPSLSSEVNNDNSQFLPATTPSSRAASLAAPILGSFNSNSEVTIVAVRAGAAIDAADQAGAGTRDRGDALGRTRWLGA